MKTMIVAIWAVNTQAMQQCTLGQRLGSLEKAAAVAYENITKRLGTLGLGLGDRPMGLFVVPEYYLAHPAGAGHHQPGDNRHISETEKATVLARLEQLSDRYKGIVMIPGTVAWRKPILRKELNDPRTGLPKPLSRQQKAINAVTRYATDMNIAHGQALAVPLGNIPAPTTQSKLALLNSGAAGPLINFSTVDFLGRSTAYVLLDGKVKVKYNKRGDFHEVLDNDRTVFVPGILDGRFSLQASPPKQRAISFGLEICLDHAFGTALRTTPNYGQVDIHIITSAAVGEQVDYLIAKDNGYIVHACSSPNASYVKRRTANFFYGSSITTCESFKEVNVHGFEMKFWDVELDLSIKTNQS